MAETKKISSSDDGKFALYEMDLNSISEEFAKEAGFMREGKKRGDAPTENQSTARKKQPAKKPSGQTPSGQRHAAKKSSGQRPTGHRVAERQKKDNFELEEFEISIPSVNEAAVQETAATQETVTFDPVTEPVNPQDAYVEFETEAAAHYKAKAAEEEENAKMTFKTPKANLEEYTESVPPRIKDTFSDKAEIAEYKAPASFASMFIPLHGDSAGTLVKKGIVIVSVLVILICIIALGVHAITATVAVPALAVIAPDTASKAGMIAAGLLL